MLNNNMKDNTAGHIGFFIKTLREERGMTQDDFAKLLNTSQSAVARMEAGKQNFTTGEVEKISKALGRKIISLSTSIDFEIHGGKKLHGSVVTNSSKNGAMGLLCASLLNKAKTILHGIPKIEEVHRLIEIMESIGVSIRWIDKNSIEIVPPKVFMMDKLDNVSASRIRSTIMMIGSLVHNLPVFKLPHAGGCKMGTEP
jgi:UDP-N-acetylglucosamine 1-carboxyvinyltransferase